MTARDAAAARQAAIDVGRATLDLRLRYEETDDVDEARLGLWQRQLVIDRARGDAGLVRGDRAVIRAIRVRIDD